MTFKMRFDTVRSSVVFAWVVSFTTSQREYYLHERRSFETCALSTSVTENVVIREEPLLTPSKAPAMPTSGWLEQHLDGLTKEENIRLLYHHLGKVRKAAQNPTKVSLLHDPRRELFLSHDKGHSASPIKEPPLREVSSFEGSSGLPKSHAQERDSRGAHMYVQHRIPQGWSTAFAGIPMQQTEMVGASNQGRSPNTVASSLSEVYPLHDPRHTEHTAIREGPLLNPSKTPALPTSGWLEQPTEVLSKEENIRQLYHLLAKERKAAQTPSKVSLPNEHRRELFLSHDKEHSASPSKESQLREASLFEGSPGSAKSHAQGKDSWEAHMTVQHSITQDLSTTSAGMPRQQAEMNRESYQGRIPNMKEIGCGEEQPVNQASSSALQHVKNSRQSQVGYYVDRDQRQGELSKDTKTRLFYQYLLKERKAASYPNEVYPAQDPGHSVLLGHSKEHYIATNKKPRLSEMLSAGGSIGLARVNIRDTTLGAQMNVQHSIPQRSSTTLSGIPIQQIEMNAPRNQGKNPQNMKEFGYEKKLPGNRESTSALEHSENLLEADGGYVVDHNQRLWLRKHQELLISNNEVDPEPRMTSVSKQYESYPSRLLAWEPGPIDPKVAHGAEMLAQQLSETLPSAFSFVNGASQTINVPSRWSDPPNQILLPLTYELLTKGITKEQWTTVHLIWRDFWEIYTDDPDHTSPIHNVQKLKFRMPIFLWFCEFLCEATLPRQFSRFSFGEKPGKRHRYNWANKDPHYSVWVTKLIRYLCIGDQKAWKMSTDIRTRAVHQLYQLSKNECSEVQKDTQFQNTQELHQILCGKLLSKSEQIRSVGSLLWGVYQRLSPTDGDSWRRDIVKHCFGLCSKNDLNWEDLLSVSYPNEKEEIRKISEGTNTLRSSPMALILNHVPLDPDKLLEEFKSIEKTRSYQKNFGLQRFLPGRIHEFFEGQK